MKKIKLTFIANQLKPSFLSGASSRRYSPNILSKAPSSLLQSYSHGGLYGYWIAIMRAHFGFHQLLLVFNRCPINSFVCFVEPSLCDIQVRSRRTKKSHEKIMLTCTTHEKCVFQFSSLLQPYRIQCQESFTSAKLSSEDQAICSSKYYCNYFSILSIVLKSLYSSLVRLIYFTFILNLNQSQIRSWQIRTPVKIAQSKVRILRQNKTRANIMFFSVTA